MKTTQTRRMTLGLALALSMGLALPGPRPGRVPGRPERLDQPDGRQKHRLGAKTRPPTWRVHPQGQQLTQNAQEFAQSVDEFRQSLHDNPDPPGSVRRMPGSRRPGNTCRGSSRARRPPRPWPRRPRSRGWTPRSVRPSGNAPPAGFSDGGAGPERGSAETQRLAHALVDRADGVVAAIQTDLWAGTRTGPPLASGTPGLARWPTPSTTPSTSNQRPGRGLRPSAPSMCFADRVERSIPTMNQVPPRGTGRLAGVRLGRGPDPPEPRPPLAPARPPGPLAPPPAEGRRRSSAWPTNSSSRSTAFVQASARRRAVPEGGSCSTTPSGSRPPPADSGRTRGKLAPNQLAFEFRDVDAVWQRLARRIDRIARGRTGPNIQQVPGSARSANSSTASSACPATRPRSTGHPSTSRRPRRSREGGGYPRAGIPVNAARASSLPTWGRVGPGHGASPG